MLDIPATRSQFNLENDEWKGKTYDDFENFPATFCTHHDPPTAILPSTPTRLIKKAFLIFSGCGFHDFVFHERWGIVFERSYQKSFSTPKTKSSREDDGSSSMLQSGSKEHLQHCPTTRIRATAVLMLANVWKRKLIVEKKSEKKLYRKHWNRASSAEKEPLFHSLTIHR